MKLMRIGAVGSERPAVISDAGDAHDVSALIGDLVPEAISDDLVGRLAGYRDQPVIDLAGARIGSPLARPGTIWCIGLNYADHAREAGAAIPDEPVVFSKAASALAGPNDTIHWHASMTKLDWEVELGIVIGRPAHRVPEDRALGHVLGYTIVNDLSERAWQMERGGQWMKGKSHPGFCPVGPWIVTRDEVPDPQALSLWLDVDGGRMQDGNTRDMIAGVARIISYLSDFTRLMPGDLICTGTPAGVGAGVKPPRFLGPGAKLRLGIDGLGEQRQQVAGA
ncbi:fumarylacetoacetate hydrolase family protein [Sphingomonas sp. RRHST34]|uniref:Fumarylacetoacetate hydrolase family protein n=1 Tax=Sphingomonas citri TaxID=2862499 RepID=A0ABS7BSQ2_9SPHN|nr:fumarylacetoacetate hydrolase family protein [Sphingomonas citri]MBW6532512.1 fumarylacetoacetate hydrolase family protein [Sphingomonas citri]